LFEILSVPHLDQLFILVSVVREQAADMKFPDQVQFDLDDEYRDIQESSIVS
jgi:hypothetical protein